MVFDRVICGIDGSEESRVAAIQAAAVTQGRLTLLAVVDPWDELLYGPAEVRHERGPHPRDVLRSALEEAAAAVGDTADVTTKIVQGRPQLALLDEIDRVQATLLVVGSHGRGRVAGIILGSIATFVAHEAPCAVMVSRASAHRGAFPSTAVVGVDGSPGSMVALEAAKSLHAARGTTIRLVAATNGADEEAVSRIADGYPCTRARGDAVSALVAESADADLVIVGSRGLHGARALGSVSERVVHHAAGSVLVTRPAAEHGSGGAAVSIADIMTAPAIVASEDATVEELLELMLDKRIGAVPIVDADGNLAGLVSEATFAGHEVRFARSGPDAKLTRILGHWLIADNLESVYRKARNLRARDVMSSPVPTVAPDESVQHALEQMVRRQITHLPVVRHGAPVGMLARRDLLKAAAATWRDRDDEQ